MSKDRSRENSASNHSASDREAQGVTRDSDATATRNDQASGMEDKVVLTDMASRLKSLEHKLATQPEIDQNHINRIREAISRGEYHVDPGRVADKMLGFEEDF